MQLFDTHCHLDDEQFDGRRDEVLARAKSAGVHTIVTVGTTASTSARCIELAGANDIVYAAVGIQPNHCAEVEPGDWDRIVEHVSSPKVVALGETGLDRYWDHTPFAIQQDYFARHLELSQQRDLPVVIHMRDCDQDVLDSLRLARSHGRLRGVMHSFTGIEATARECVELGLHISFAGMVTYKKSEELRRIASLVPSDRIVVETDAPYLSPHPVRGQRPNEPALVVHTAECLAQVRGVSVEEFARQTTNNARELFRVG